MGATLQVASQKAAYTISHSGTYLAEQKNIDLDILFQASLAPLNVYHVIVVNPAKHPEGECRRCARVCGVCSRGRHPEAHIRAFGRSSTTRCCSSRTPASRTRPRQGRQRRPAAPLRSDERRLERRHFPHTALGTLYCHASERHLLVWHNR